MVGPTASGKSQWALAQAKKYGGCIVNSDSVQFYKGLQIGSAAPTDLEKKLVPHYLYSEKEAPLEMTAGHFVRDFYLLLDKKILKSPVFIVGGTGFYIQALEKGMFDLEPADLELRAQVENELLKKGAVTLLAELTAADPSHVIHLNDHYRLVRAIEILRSTGQTPAMLRIKTVALENKNAFPFPFIKVGFSETKEFAREQIEKRTQRMIEGGIIEETSYFLNHGFASWAPLASVGYKDVVDFLLHNKSKTQLFDNMVISTMQLIKKQKTWFKRDPAILWSDSKAENQIKIENQLDLFLTSIDPRATEKG